MSTYSTTATTRKIKKNITNLAVLKNKEDVSEVKRDFRFFGCDLFTINSKPLNTKLSDGKISSISHMNENDDIAIFIKMFNKGNESNKVNYYLNNDSEFYLTDYYNKKFVIILDKINNLSSNKRCFNMNCVLFAKVQDTLNPNGELKRDGEKYTA